MRPQSLDDLVGQEHLVGEGGAIRKMLKTGHLTSMIFWGPPGTGKTTLAEIIANEGSREFYRLSAISAGVKDVREIIEQAKKSNLYEEKSPILFIDEIHRFNKSQQDSLLEAVEKGYILLIGATTENPSFEVVSALLSRSQVFVLNSLSAAELLTLANRAVEIFNRMYGSELAFDNLEPVVQIAGGDGRKLINTVELILNHYLPQSKALINSDNISTVIQKNVALYDKNGEMHYDIISAFIKCIRGSDPNAAVYWLARMLEGGEDIKFIARRLVILASEDIGLANPQALILAQSCFQAVTMVGMPEARIILSETAVYLAVSPKSNSTYTAINEAMALVRKTGNLPVPLHLRNAPTKLMKDLDYGKDYRYAHAYNNNFVAQQYLPEEIGSTVFYVPGKNVTENKILEELSRKWPDKYKKSRKDSD